MVVFGLGRGGGLLLPLVVGLATAVWALRAGRRRRAERAMRSWLRIDT